VLDPWPPDTQPIDQIAAGREALVCVAPDASMLQGTSSTNTFRLRCKGPGFLLAFPISPSDAFLLSV
jgi:hypothetical protein